MSSAKEFIKNSCEITLIVASTIAMLPILGSVGAVSLVGGVIAVSIGTAASAYDNYNSRND